MGDRTLAKPQPFGGVPGGTLFLLLCAVSALGGSAGVSVPM